MEDDGRKAETSQSPNHSNNGSNEPTNFPTISPVCNCLLLRSAENYESQNVKPLRSLFTLLNTVTFSMERKLIIFEPLKLLRLQLEEYYEMQRKCPIIDSWSIDKLRNEENHERDEKNQETLHRCSISCAPVLLSGRKFHGDQNMDRYGIKDTAFQSRNKSDKGSKVHNQFQAPKMQTIHFWDDLYFSSPVIPLKPCTIRSVVKDESTVPNRDRADRSQKVTDTPEVLDTHLTKEDVDSKVPQNNWRERIFSLRWKHLSVHQFIVVFLLMISSVQGITSHCGTIRTMNCTQLFLTCNFDTDINQLARNLYMNHVQNNSVDLEIILVCKRSSKGFHCEASPSYEFVSVESNRLTVKIPKVNLEHGGKYWCNVYGLDIDQKVCQLDLTDSSSEDCFEQENRPSGKDDRLSPATIAIIVLSITLLLVTSLIVIYFRSSGRAKYIATCFNLKNYKLGRSAPTTNTKEECEKL